MGEGDEESGMSILNKLQRVLLSVDYFVNSHVFVGNDQNEYL